MAVDYVSLRKENERRYGTDIDLWGPMLLADRYEDRTHFIFELLQNAEDALARRQSWRGSRAVRFTLSATELRVVHCGQPFNDPDVRGICGIAEGTKEKDCTAIGRFGIGFKSVNAFTDRPEIHSGDEDFTIEHFVRPIAITALDRQADETVFVLPLRAGDEAAHAQIAEGLRRLGPRTLLFLRQIDEIAWRVDGGPSGLYVRGKPEPIGENIRQIVLLGEEDGKPDVEETWLLFSRQAETPDGKKAGHVEIAFAINPADECGRYSIQAVSDSPLVVFFPTVLPTHLGFLVQGPYRTTPSRDLVPRNDPWNQHLAKETAALLVEALCSLRAQGLLDVDALRSLPLDRAKFGEGHMFAPLFAAVREAFRTEPLLPTAGEGHTAAGTAKLARTHELRDLFSPRQLANVFGGDGDMFWLSGSITQDRTPELRQYVMRELAIVEVTPEAILPKLTQAFLQEQSDEWTGRLYEFLHGQPALLRQGRLKDVPLVRLEDGSHVTPTKDGRPQAFLPGPIATNFPTVRSVACNTEAARALLLELGLTEPDPVDDVVRNVLPKYVREENDVDDAEYETDIRHILTAFGTDSKGSQREKLLAALRESYFVMAVDTGNRSKCMSRPSEVYLATERLTNLFVDVTGVLLVDDDQSCLRGEDVRALLEACGATRYLQPVRVSSRLNWQELADMRTRTGSANNTGRDEVEDFTLRGLDKLLATWTRPGAERPAKKAALLWESLCDVEDRRGRTAFLGTYKWYYFHSRSCVFDAAFVRQLNETAWVPDANGDWQRPEFVVFDTLGWKPNPFLLSKIRFKPPIIEQLAKEAGIEPGVLDMLKKLGLTSVTGLMARLKVDEATESGSDDQTRSSDGGERTSRNTHHGAPAETPASRDDQGDSNAGEETGAGNAHSDAEKQRSNVSSSSGKGSTRHQNNGLERRFVSYVATHPEDDDEAERDGLSHAERLGLEQQAISLIRSREPLLHVMPASNKGFDLIETDAIGEPQRWIEVKAMKGSLEDRPVGLSRVQFEFARQHGEQYWLYVVEHAGAPDLARIVKVQNPAGRTGTFTFDHGWIEIADIDGPQQKAS